MTNEPKFFKVEKDGAVIIWRFYHPPRNLWTAEVGPEFEQLQESFYQDPSLRVGIFTSGIPEFFIQHYDVSLLVKMGEQLSQEKSPAPLPRRVGFRRDSKPIIAAINATLSGWGLELAMSCDFRFMSHAASAAQSEVNVGILAGGGGTQRMLRLIGLARTLELQLTGRPIFADEAERIGLITRACDPLRLMPEALEFARELANRPPLAVNHIRRCLYEGMSLTLDDGLALEAELMREVLKSDEALERMRAYVATGQDPKRAQELSEQQQKQAKA
jgi:enoyl-CoA hydratase